MGAMNANNPDLEEHGKNVAATGIDAIITGLNTPYDAMIPNNYRKNTKIVKNEDVIVGDLAFAGHSEGVVTEIIGNKQIKVVFQTAYKQNISDTELQNRSLIINFEDNTAGPEDGTGVTYNPVSMAGGAIIFLRIIT